LGRVAAAMVGVESGLGLKSDPARVRVVGHRMQDDQVLVLVLDSNHTVFPVPESIWIHGISRS
jgi:hypothetical protein